MYPQDWLVVANGAEQKVGLSRSQARFEGLTEAWEAGQGRGTGRQGPLDLCIGTRHTQRDRMLPRVVYQ